ncbi:MAG: hypothetical protein U0939_20575 [Pirellulales bacterium]
MEVRIRRWTPWSGWFLLALLGLHQAFVFGDDPAADDPAPPRSIPVVPDSPQIAPPVQRDPVLEEILRLRRSLGGPLPGQALDERQFAEALRRIAQPADGIPAAPATDAPVPDASSPVDPPADAAPLLPLTDPDEGLTGDPTAAPQFLDQHLVDMLRHTSRELDARACDLDDQRRFDTADRLRKLARRMRTELRHLEESQPARGPN